MAQKIEYVALNLIKPYEKNPRRNEKAVRAVRNSIRQFGFRNPIILDRDNVIIAGHTRFLAAHDLYMETVPCVYADDLTEEQVRAYRLADNKTAEFSEWDDVLLEEALDDLSFDFDMSDFGFRVPEAEEKENKKEAEKENVKQHTCPRCGHTWSD